MRVFNLPGLEGTVSSWACLSRFDFNMPVFSYISDLLYKLINGTILRSREFIRWYLRVGADR